ncbi:MAG: hypothetical protein NVS2B3_08510 [Vulcanimicrobiaceae bacterium]
MRFDTADVGGDEDLGGARRVRGVDADRAERRFDEAREPLFGREPIVGIDGRIDDGWSLQMVRRVQRTPEVNCSTVAPAFEMPS